MHHYQLRRSIIWSEWSQRIRSQVFSPHFLLLYNSIISRLLNFFFPTTSFTTFPLFSLHHHPHHYHYILHSNDQEKMRIAVERASLPSPSIICTIFVTRIGEPELEQFVFLNGQWKRQEMNLYNYVTTQWSLRALDLRTRASTSTRFNLTFLCVKMKKSKWSFLRCLFFTKKVSTVI